jgi:Tol biopolymer transport system component
MPRKSIVCCVAAMAFCCGVARGQDSKRTAIFVIKKDGSGMRKVVQMPDNLGSPRWSHDGKRLAFDAIHHATFVKKLYIVNLDGSGLQEVGDAAMPDWSPDDKQLVLFSGAGSFIGDLGPGVYSQNVDGAGRNKLADGEGPRWSPDGTKIAYTDRLRLTTIDVVSGEQQELLDEPFERVYVGFDWSPDGKQLAFIGGRNNARDLIIIDVAGANRNMRVRLTSNLMDGHVSWSPNGKQLVFSMLTSIYFIDVEKGHPRLVPRVKGFAFDPSWSPDGAWVTFSGSYETSGQ